MNQSVKTNLWSGFRRKHVAALLAGPAMILAILSPAWGAADEPLYRRVVLLENAEVLAVEVRYEPGSASPLHSHKYPGRVIYVESGGTLEITPGRLLDDGTLELVPDGEAMRINITAGQTLWLPSQTHSLRNVGKTFIRIVEIEIKNAAP
ncbi:MAG: hypothetical protein VCD50_00805 [Alphaproteobacteria bacterium]|jgi:quercetin dioxygenase-like cupin family protein